MSADVHITRIQRLKKHLPSWADDLSRLERLIDVDVGASLHKLRTLAERLVHEVAARHGQRWEAGESMDRLGRDGHLPSDVITHLRAVTTWAELGDHYRVEAPAQQHLTDALDAFLAAVEWYRSTQLAASESATLHPGDQVQDYEVEAILGVGGMATVYQVRHRTLGARRALKLLDVPGKMVRERLVREGQIQSRLQHPNVVSVIDVVSHEGRSGLLMEFVEGIDLDALLTDGGLPPEQLDTVIEGILSGVAAAHALGVVHRDLKPSNIMIVRGAPWVAKVADFGIAKVTEPAGGAGLTKTGHIFGTPRYMSPEQFEDTSNVDARGDVWSIGCILYELSTGQFAFDAADPLAVWERVSQLDYVRVRTLAPDAPGRLVDLIERCLTLDRDARPKDAGELLAWWTSHPSVARTLPKVAKVVRRAPEAISLAPTVLHAAPSSSENEQGSEASPSVVVRQNTRLPYLVAAGGAAFLLVTVLSALALSAAGIAWFSQSGP